MEAESNLLFAPLSTNQRNGGFNQGSNMAEDRSNQGSNMARDRSNQGSNMARDRSNRGSNMAGDRSNQVTNLAGDGSNQGSNMAENPLDEHNSLKTNSVHVFGQNCYIMTESGFELLGPARKCVKDRKSNPRSIWDSLSSIPILNTFARTIGFES